MMRSYHMVARLLLASLILFAGMTAFFTWVFWENETKTWWLFSPLAFSLVSFCVLGELAEGRLLLRLHSRTLFYVLSGQLALFYIWRAFIPGSVEKQYWSLLVGVMWVSIVWLTLRRVSKSRGKKNT